MIGAFSSGLRWIVNPYAVLDEAVSRQGSTFFLRLPSMGNVLFTGEPELIEAIIRNDDLEAGRAISILDKALGEKSMITLDGPAHANRKRSLAPLMNERNVAKFDELTLSCTRRALESKSLERPFSSYEFVRQISLRVIVELLFGSDDEAAILGMIEACDAFLKSFASPLPLMISPLRVDLGPWSPWGAALRKRCVLEQKIQARLATSALPPDLSPREAVTEALSLLAFGHDTAAATLSWAFHHVLGHDEARHLVSTTGDDSVIESCLKESMRLRPVVVHLSRKARVATKVGAHEIAAGALVAPSAYLAQRNPVNFERPDTFDPRRFLDAPNPPRSTFFPYGLANRVCYGRPLAQRQMMLIFKTALREYRLDLIDQREIPSRKMVLMIPRAGAPVKRSA